MTDSDGYEIHNGDRVRLVNGPSDLPSDLLGRVLGFTDMTAVVRWENGQTFEAPGNQLSVWR